MALQTHRSFDATRSATVYSHTIKEAIMQRFIDITVALAGLFLVPAIIVYCIGLAALFAVLA